MSSRRTVVPSPHNQQVTGRPRHQDKHIEALLRRLEAKGWRVEKTTYFRVKCPEGCKCIRSVHLTPSDPTYLRNLSMWLRRRPCWREEEQ